MVIVEKSFPRGGVVSKEEKDEAKDANIIFGATQQKIRKHKPKKSKDRISATSEDGEEQLKTFSAELLNYDTIQDGMNIMGIIESVDQLYVSIALPGRMVARASALEISDAYTKITQEFLQNAEKATDGFKPLHELLSVGQIVYARVKEIKQKKNGRKLINMSLKPSEVHADLQHTNIKKGSIFKGAIEEIQEHGYIIESGIRGLRTFMPLDKSQAGHAVGELIFLKVDKITHDQTASTSICKEVAVDNLKVKPQTDANIDYILPASIVKFNVVKQLKDGLQGTIMNETFTAYINEHQLAEALALPEDYEIKSQLNARVLYVMPLTKLVYLTLNLRTKSGDNENEDAAVVEEQLKPGDVIENARVHHLGTGGVILVLNNKFKGVLSHKTIRATYKGNYDQDALLLKYAKKTKHKVRVLRYDVVDSLYICTDVPKVVEQKIFTLADVQAGEFVTATVKKKDTLIGGYVLAIGKIRAIIEKLFLAPNTKNLEGNAQVRCRVIAVNLERNLVYLTNRPEYLSKTCKLLTSLSDAKKNSIFTGTVVKCEAHFVLVKFFNNLKGVLLKQQLNGYMATESDSFYEGQTMKFRVESRNDEQIKLTLPEDTFSLGEICPVEVVNALDSGLEIKISFPGDEKDGEVEMEEFKGLVPNRLLSDFVDLLRVKQRVLSKQTEAEAVCIAKNIFSVRDVDYFRNNLTTEWHNVKTGDVLRAFVKSVQNEVVVLFVPIRNYNKLVKLHLKMFFVNAIRGAKIELAPEQVVFVKVLSMEPTTKTVTVSAKLTDVWSGELSKTASFVESYLAEVESIKKSLKKLSEPIAKYAIGDKLTVEFQGINEETNDWLYVVEKTKTVAVLRPTFFGKAKPPAVGTKQKCIVLWIDYSNELLLISNKSFDIAHISKEKNLAQNLVGKTGINAKVLLRLENVVICSMKKGENPLVFCPTRLHYNDFEQTCSNPLKEGEFVKLAFIHEKLAIAVPESIWKLWKNIKRKSEEELVDIKQKRAKLEARRTARSLKAEAQAEAEITETEEEDKILLDATKSKKCTENAAVVNVKASKPAKKEKRAAEQAPIADKENKVAKIVEATQSETGSALFFEDTAPEKQAAASEKKKEATKYLPGISDFWNADISQLNGTSNQAESSDEDDSHEDVPLKKKRLTATEKFKQQRDEESRLRAIEEKNADPNHMPETADQFDRLVLGGPNDSKNWINYMVFHMQSAEIEKAREVARRALRTISFRESNELLNVWVALLNLELRYGNKDSFDDVLKEALIRNEPLTIYLRVLDIYTDAKKTTELLDVIGILTKKFRAEPEVWRAAANAYFAIDMAERGQQLMHRALACLPEREHVNLIVSFANLNHKYGNNEMAQTLLDQIVTSYPKRVDVWTQYVDMLVKAQLVDSARTVLERAVMQKIPLKKMRTIFKKYLEFEERFGNDENVQKVKQLATEFVKSSTTL